MKNGQTILNMILSGVLTLLGALQLWAFTSIVEHGERIVALEANRFTAEDGLDVWKQIAAVREEVAKIPKEAPPQWFIQRVDKLEEDIAEIRHMIVEMHNDP